MKRILAVFLLAVMLFSTACGQQGELLSFIDNNVSGKLDGLEVKWVWTGGTITTPKYVIDTPQYDSLMGRIAEVEEELDCDIVYNIPTGDAVLDRGLDVVNVEAEVMAGSMQYDIIFTNLHSESVHNQFQDSLTNPVSQNGKLSDSKV